MYFHSVRRMRNRQNRLLGRLVATLLVAAALSGLGSVSPGSASAQSAEAQAYVWANDPLSETYTPNEAYQFNSSNELNTITRTDVGAYTVEMPNMAPGEGNIQVTATSGSVDGAPFAPGHLCEITKEPKTAGQALQAFVTCADADGAPVDTGFMLLYTSGNVFLGAHSAYVLAHDSAAESYTPNERYQFNYTDTPNTINHPETGVYDVVLPGLGVETGNIQVTAAHGPAGISCTVSHWGIDDAANKIVTVICFDADGTLVDSEFTLLHAAGSTSEEEWMVWARGAYVWVNHGEAAKRHTPGAKFQFNSTGGTNEVERTGAGAYTVFLPGIGAETGNIQITAFGSETPAVACKLQKWNLVDDVNYEILVLCYDADGAPADSRFMLSYSQLEP